MLGAKQRSLYELTDAISSRNSARALALLHGLLNSSDAGEDAAIGHLYMLARTFRQMLVILEKNVRDSRAIWQALWQGFRMPPFAADDLIRQARRYKSRRELTRALRLIARADLELRSSPPDKRLVLERLVYDLASEPKAGPAGRGLRRSCRSRGSRNGRSDAKRLKSRFFVHHPQTLPQRAKTALRGPRTTFGAPFSQNDSAMMGEFQNKDTRAASQPAKAMRCRRDPLAGYGW